MANLGLLTFLTVLSEGSVEYFFSPIFTNSPKLEPYKWMLMYVSALVGVVVAYSYQVDLIALLGLAPQSVVGVVLTGLVIGRGANFVHDLLKGFAL